MSVEGSHLYPKNVATMESFFIPNSVTNVKAFLGLIGYSDDLFLGMPRL